MDRIWPSELWLRHVPSCSNPRKCDHPVAWPDWWLAMSQRGVPFHPDREEALQMALRRIAGFKGRGYDHKPEAQEFVRAVTVDALIVAPQPVTKGWVHTTLMATSGLVRWALGAGERLDRDHLFSERTRNRFLNLGCGHLTDTAVRNYKCRLDLIAAAFSDGAAEPFVQSTTRQLFPEEAVEPHSGADLDALWRWANWLRPATRRRRVMATLVLSAGCGLRSREIVAVRPADVSVDDHGVHVSVGGNKPRTVTCLAAWEDELILLRDSTTEERPILSPWRDEPTTSKFLSTLTGATQTGNEPPVWFSPRSLRNTWIVSHLTHGTRGDVLLAAAGIESLESFMSYLPHLKEPDDIECARLLRGPVT